MGATATPPKAKITPRGCVACRDPGFDRPPLDPGAKPDVHQGQPKQAELAPILEKRHALLRAHWRRSWRCAAQFLLPELSPAAHHPHIQDHHKQPVSRPQPDEQPREKALD